MKGLNGAPQQMLWNFRDRHKEGETYIVAAIMTMIPAATIDRAVREYRMAGHHSSGKRPYTKQIMNAPQPRRRSRYGFAQLVDDPNGRLYITSEFKVTTGWIVENARGFARRWRLDLTYEKGDGQVRIWLRKSDQRATE